MLDSCISRSIHYIWRPIENHVMNRDNRNGKLLLSSFQLILLLHLSMILTCDVDVDPVTEQGSVCVARDTLIHARILQLNLGYP